MTAPLLDWFAREHPAWVHLPLGLVIALPLAMAWSYVPGQARRATATSLFLAALALGGSLLALVSGLLWARLVNLLPLHGWVPELAGAGQALQRVLRAHEGAAVAGVGLGIACTTLLLFRWRHLRRDSSPEGRGWMQRGVGPVAFLAALAWLGAWGLCGRLGGTMVFGNEELNRAAAAADKARKADVESEVPIRALDYASLEPVQDRPVRSAAHGGRWIRTWVTASGVDAYREGRPLPAGAYVVLSTVEDVKGRPAWDPGPLFMKEIRADGGVAFTFYWARVPERMRNQTGGEDSVYWRSPDPRLAHCAQCHTDARPGRAPLKEP